VGKSGSITAHSSSDKSNRMIKLPFRILESHFRNRNQYVKLGSGPSKIV
jgi:hypothetical protein